MGQLSGLKGTNGQNIECIFIEKASHIKSIIKKGLAATAAGSNGAINIYKDDAGNIRCEAMRYCATIDEKLFANIDDAIVWVDEWLPKIN